MATRAGSVVLVLLGAVLLVASLLRSDGNDVYSLGPLVFGGGLVVLGVVLPRLRNAGVGQATPVSADDVARVLSQALASGPRGSG